MLSLRTPKLVHRQRPDPFLIFSHIIFPHTKIPYDPGYVPIIDPLGARDHDMLEDRRCRTYQYTRRPRSRHSVAPPQSCSWIDWGWACGRLDSGLSGSYKGPVCTAGAWARVRSSVGALPGPGRRWGSALPNPGTAACRRWPVVVAVSLYSQHIAMENMTMPVIYSLKCKNRSSRQHQPHRDLGQREVMLR